MWLPIVVIIIVLLFFFLGWFFFQKAFHRPRAKDLSDENVLLTSDLFGYTPALKPALTWFRQQAWEDVSVTAHDGAELRGLFLPRKGAKVCLIMQHGYGSLPQDLCVVAQWASKRKYALLLPYMRAYGPSGGEYCSLGLLEAEDCLRWIREAAELQEGAKVVLYGADMGAYSSLRALGLPDVPEIAAVISDGAYTGPKEILRHTMKNQMRMRVFPLLQLLCLYGRLMWKRWPGGADLRLTIKENKKVPVLFIHGRQDLRVPSSMTEEIAKACASAKVTYIAEDAGHAATALADSETYFAELEAFLDAVLTNPPISPKTP